MHKPALDACSERLGNLLQQGKLKVVTAESCTGGGLAEIITRIPGSSAWFDRGFITYSNAAKQEQLGVPAEIINHQGAVSEATALAMCKGALEYSQADLGMAITGIAGPGGGTADKPVGTVCFAWGNKTTGTYWTVQRIFHGDRLSIRIQACEAALTGLIEHLQAVT